MRLCNVLQTKQWFANVGLEIHAQIVSLSKIFSNGLTNFQDRPPNSAVALFDIALPGTMPVLNIGCVKAGIKTALAVGAKLNMISYFDRKHYFYPDLPAGYQITQKGVPLAVGGSLLVPIQSSDEKLNVRFQQIQLEQDSGKIVFGESLGEHGREILVDFNRAGIGLMELVTEPDMKSGLEAASFVKELRLLLRKLETCDGNIQDGSLRVDANISIKKSESSPLGTKTEIKNISGFKFLAKAIDYEIKRHISELENGREIIEETRSFDERRGITVATRGKSELQDYRFMAEHDLPPLVLYSDSLPPPVSEFKEPVINIDELRRELPELPSELRTRLYQIYGLNSTQIQVLMGETGAVEYFEDVIKNLPNDVDTQTVYALVTSELYGILDERKVGFDKSPVSVDQMVSLVAMLHEGQVTRALGKQILKQMANEDSKLASSIKKELKLESLDEDELLKACQQIISLNPDQVVQYCSGTTKVLGYFVGEVMKLTKYKQDPKTIKILLTKSLEKLKN